MLPAQFSHHHHLVEAMPGGFFGTTYHLRETFGEGREVGLKVFGPHSGSCPAESIRHIARSLENQRATPRATLATPYQWNLTDEYWLLREWVIGENLGTARPSGLLEAMRVLRSTAAALQPLHQDSLVHGCLKPTNVLLVDRAQQTVRLVDAGLNPLLSVASTDVADGLHTTWPFLSPEHAGSLPGGVDARSDLYSLGVLAYWLVSGQVPFSADSLAALLHEHAARSPRPLRETVSVPPFIEEMVARLLRKERSDRYPSVEAVLRDMDEACHRLETGHTAAKPVPSAMPPAGGSLVVGRERQLQALRETLAEVRGGAGRITLIAGTAGSGKTCLVQSMRGAIDAAGLLFCFGKCDPSAIKRPYQALGAAADALSSWWGTQPALRREALRERLRESLGLSAHALVRTLPELVPLLGEPSGPEPETDHAAQVVQRGLADLLASLAAEGCPVVLALDDLQWAHPALLDLLASISRHLTDCRAWVLCTVRQEEQGGARALERLASGTSIVSCPPLIEADLKELVTRLTGRAPGESEFLGNLLWRRSGGNPFAMMEILRSLMAGGAVLRRPFGWEVDERSCEALAVPDSLAGLTRARIDQLDGETRQLLELAALSGSGVDPEVLARAAGRPLESVRVGLRSACDSLILEPHEARFRFLHDRIQEAIVEALDASRRAEIHLALARALEAATPRDPFALAHHFLEAGNPDRALAYVVEATQAAREAFAWSAVVALCRQGLELVERLPETLAEIHDVLQLRLGHALYSQGEFEPARKILQARLQTPLSLHDRVDTLDLLSRVEQGDGHTRRAAEILSEALATLGERAPSTRLGLYSANLRLLAGYLVSPLLWPRCRVAPEMRRTAVRLYHYAAVYWYYLDEGWSLYMHLNSMRLVHGQPDTEERVRVLGAHSATAGSFGFTKVAVRYAHLTKEVARKVGTQSALAGGLFYSAAGLYHAGLWAGAAVEAPVALEANRAVGDYWTALQCAAATSLSLLALGQTQAARAHYERCRDWASELGSRTQGLPAIVLSNAVGSRFAILDGRYDEAQSLARRARDVADEVPDRAIKLVGYNAFGRVALANGAVEEAVKILEASVREMFAYGVVHKFAAEGAELLANACSLAYEANPDASNLARCRLAFLKAFIWGTMHASILPALWCAVARVERARKRPRAAWKAAERGVQCARQNGMRHEEGRALQMRGQIEQDTGHAEAGATLLQAEELLDAAGDRVGVAEIRRLRRHDVQTAPPAEAAVGQATLGLAHRVWQSRVLELSRNIACTPHLEALIPILLASALESTGAQRAILVLRDDVCAGVPFLEHGSVLCHLGNHDFLGCASHGDESGSPPVSRAALEQGLTEGSLVHLTNVDGHHDLFPEALDPQPVRSIAVIPLMAQSSASGAIYLDSTQVYQLAGGAGHDFLEGLGGLTAVALHNAVHLARLEVAHALGVAEREQRHAQELRVKQFEARKDGLVAFLGIAAHDLGSPLMTIRMMASLLKPGVSEETLGVCSRNLENAASSALSLIRQYLQVATVEGGGALAINPISFDAHRLVRDEWDLQVAALPEHRRAALHLDCHLAEGQAWGDVDHLRQVVANLLGNALKYAREGRIIVHSSLDEGCFRFEVADEGPGIDEADQERLFQPFERVDSHHPGSGLGLWIARTVVEAHDGRIGVESAPDQGSTFWFEIPLPDSLSDTQGD